MCSGCVGQKSDQNNNALGAKDKGLLLCLSHKSIWLDVLEILLRSTYPLLWSPFLLPLLYWILMLNLSFSLLQASERRGTDSLNLALLAYSLVFLDSLLIHMVFEKQFYCFRESILINTVPIWSLRVEFKQTTPDANS